MLTLPRLFRRARPAGVQLQAACEGSVGRGTVVVGGAREDENDDGSPGALSLQVLRVMVGDEDFYLVEP